MVESWEILEQRVRAIDAQIVQLKQEREQVLREDEEYAAYLDAFDAYGEGQSLSIGRFYELSAELEEINREFMAVEPLTDEYQELWRRRGGWLFELETLLCA